MNPFKEKPISIEKSLQNWKDLYPKSYDKREVDPYTKTRIILMNGTEFEANWFLHQFQRNCSNNNVRRALAVMRRSEQLQQKLISLMRKVRMPLEIQMCMTSLFRRSPRSYSRVQQARL